MSLLSDSGPDPAPFPIDAVELFRRLHLFADRLPVEDEHCTHQAVTLLAINARDNPAAFAKGMEGKV